VEGAGVHTAAQAEPAQAVAQLAGRLAGEGHREDPVGVERAHRRAVGDPVREDPGLAGAGAGQDAQRRRLGHHGLVLGRVEAARQVAGGDRIVVGRGVGEPGAFG
jgi:hypothetical protein